MPVGAAVGYGRKMARPRNQSARREALIEATYTAGRRRGLRSLSLSDVAEQAGLTRGAILYYYDDLDALLVEAHAAGVERFCDERDRLIAATDDPRAQLAAAIDAGLPSGPDDALMRLLYEFDLLAGYSTLHDDWCRSSTCASRRPTGVSSPLGERPACSRRISATISSR